jgi:hypothetical protein
MSIKIFRKFLDHLYSKCEDSEIINIKSKRDNMLNIGKLADKNFNIC